MKLWWLLTILTFSILAEGKEFVKDEPFLQESVTQISNTELKVSSIQDSLCDKNGRLWILGGKSINVLENGKWRRLDQRLKIPVTPGMRMVEDGRGAVFFVGSKGFWRYPMGSRVEYIAFDFGNINDLAVGRDTLWIASDSGVYSRTRDGKIQHIAKIGEAGEAIEWNESLGAAVGTARALYTGKGNKWNHAYINGFIEDSITSLAYDTEGSLWIGGASCINILHKDGTCDRIGGMQGLPYNHVLCITQGWDGDMWIGTEKGAIRYNQGIWNYYYGPRWLPGESVFDISIDAKNKIAWMTTDHGMSKIAFQPWNLARKAAYYQTMISPRHDRHGLVADCVLKQFGNLSSYVLKDNDNDGLWTGMYLAALCFQYAETRDPEVKKQAWRHFEAMERLESVTGIPGFFARSYVANGEPHEQGGEWHNTPDGQWTWKGDTSSDELVGHLFVYPLVYDLLAQTKEEKERVSKLVSVMMNYVVDNGYYLNDIDGKHTRWGVWAPEILNNNPKWVAERGLNSLQMLSFLLAAYHVTGEDKFLASFQNLVEEHGYAENTINQKILIPSENNHSDDELAFLPYYILFRYLDKYITDQETKSVLQSSLDRSWAIEAPEKSSLWNVIYGSTEAAKFGLEDAVNTLREWPLDLIKHPVHNSHRLDVSIDPNLSRHGRKQAIKALAPDERCIMRWNGNPFQLDGGNGLAEDDPGAWLLPYWMAVYYDFIQ